MKRISLFKRLKKDMKYGINRRMLYDAFGVCGLSAKNAKCPKRAWLYLKLSNLFKP